MIIGIGVGTAFTNRFADKTPPDVPTSLTATAGNSQVSLDWDDDQWAWDVSGWDNGYWGPPTMDLAGYNVYVDSVKNNPTLITDPNYIVTGLTNAVAYTFTVTAMDYGGNESDPSDPVIATPSL